MATKKTTQCLMSHIHKLKVTYDEGNFHKCHLIIRLSKIKFRRDKCTSGYGSHPMYVNVHMKDGSIANTWIDSLQASFAAVQVHPLIIYSKLKFCLKTSFQILNGDIEEAVCQHALYYGIWKKYGVLPERYNWKLKWSYFYPISRFTMFLIDPCDFPGHLMLLFIRWDRNSLSRLIFCTWARKIRSICMLAKKFWKVLRKLPKRSKYTLCM